MKRITLSVPVLLFLASSALVVAEEQVIPESPAETVASGSETSATVTSGTPRKMAGKGMMHKGKGHHAKGHGGMKHGGGHHEKHRQVVQRLDMIDARLAKIEAMLETLMRR